MCSNGINDQSRSQFKCALENLDSYDLEHSISDNCSSPSQESMDSLWEKLNFTLIDTAKWLGICKVIPTPKLSNVVRNPIDKPWFDASCHDLKREYLELKRRVRNTPISNRHEEQFNDLSTLAKKYKKFEQKKKSNYFKALIILSKSVYNTFFLLDV